MFVGRFPPKIPKVLAGEGVAFCSVQFTDLFFWRTKNPQPASKNAKKLGLYW